MNPRPAYGIVAGSGVLPKALCQRIVDAGHDCVVAGIAGHACPSHFENAMFQSFGIGRISSVAAFFKQYQVNAAYMAGGVSWRHGWTHIHWGVEMFAAIGTTLLRGDDAGLKYLAQRFYACGITMRDAAEWLSEWIAAEGRLAGPAPSVQTAALISRGIRVAQAFSKRTQGQSVTVWGDQWVGYEDRNGTTALLAATPGPGAVLVKLKKSAQDTRFDRPSIGPSTVIAARKVGIKAIVVQSKEVILLEKNRTIDLCNQFNISLLGISM